MPDSFDIRRERIESDKDFERALRPMTFDDFSGQEWRVARPHIAARASGLGQDHAVEYRCQ